MEPADVTHLLSAVHRGEADAPGRLMQAVHAELRHMAAAKMRLERPDHTLQPTALVNEAYLRLRGSAGSLEDRAHFFGAAAKAMERVLVDHARQRKAQKRGGEVARVTLNDLAVESPEGDTDVVAVHEAVAALEQENPELATLVRYRYFVGLTLEQIVEIHGGSLATLKRRWTFARAWLYDRLDG
ncbi:MAG: RNA polymerase subunit sigma-70 [Planctomycetes bacterium]|nr:RNA polymerase subunit sigma-70 [Planctomycetota bacterium]